MKKRPQTTVFPCFPSKKKKKHAPILVPRRNSPPCPPPNRPRRVSKKRRASAMASAEAMSGSNFCSTPSSAWRQLAGRRTRPGSVRDVLLIISIYIYRCIHIIQRYGNMCPCTHIYIYIYCVFVYRHIKKSSLSLNWSVLFFNGWTPEQGGAPYGLPLRWKCLFFANPGCDWWVGWLVGWLAGWLDGWPHPRHH